MVLHCPACRSRHFHPLYRWEGLPLGVLSLPRSEKEALESKRHAIALRRCALCGHVYHAEFSEKTASYAGDSTLVFNQSAQWLEHQATLAQQWIQKLGLKGKHVVEIGCGEGAFLEHFQKAGCEVTGFEPGADAKAAQARGIQVRRENFDAGALQSLKPDAIVCRHVLEHLADPAHLLESIALACAETGIRPAFLAEVPRIEKCLAQHRMGDFFYEHVSHFTEHSLRTLFERSGYEVTHVESRYGDEVVVLTATPTQNPAFAQYRLESRAFSESISRQALVAKETVKQWKAAKKNIALWGAAGKGAALINMLGFAKEDFPVVVDSDPNKADLFVPGTGQKIRPPSYLKEHPVDGILICTNWRARDIEKEIRERHQLGVALYVLVDEKIVELTAAVKI